MSLFNQAVATKRYGDWLQQHKQVPQALRKWREAGEKYALALQFNPHDHKAANNWGIALNAEARVAEQDLPEARRLWQQAGEKYARALAIKPDKHEAANNWGITLDAEAHTVALEEQAAFWQEKMAEVLALRNTSPAHQASTVIQNLVEKIEHQCAPES